MRRAFLCLLWSVAAVAQTPPREPLDLAFEAYWKARGEGRFEEAVAKREEAAALLDRAPVDDARFGSWAASVSQLYQNAGMTVRARTIMEAALARANRLGESHSSRITVLTSLADSWQQDGNLLKAVVYLEQAAAAAAAAGPQGNATPIPTAVVPTNRVVRTGFMVGVIGSSPGGLTPMIAGDRWFAPARFGMYWGGPSDPSSLYQRLAEMYRQLGRKDAAAGVQEKIRTLLRGNDMALASFYERQDQPEEAAALYQKLAGQTGNPEQRSAALQALSNYYMRQGRHREAALALQQSIAATEMAEKAEARNPFWMRLNLANLLHQAGQDQQAGEIYGQALVESQKTPGQEPQVLTSYATFLASTKRSADADRLLKDYLANHPNLEPSQQAQILYSLSQVARMSGDGKRAEEYQRSAQEKQSTVAGPAGRAQIGKIFERAQSAINQGNIDEAVSLSFEAIEAAAAAPDREQIAHQMPSIAMQLSSRGQAPKADLIFERLLGVVQSWSTDTLLPFLNVSQQYAQYLSTQAHQHQRYSETEAAIGRYKAALIAAHGAGTGHLAEVFRMTLELQRAPGRIERAIQSGEEWMDFQETLTGKTSDGYLAAMQTLAPLYEANQQWERSLPLRLQTVEIADLVSRGNDPRRAHVRIEAAQALAARERFDEAERLASEAVTIGESLRPRQSDHFANTLDRIRAMKKDRLRL